MQVSCSHCGAMYEFDAAAIPAAGYDAQCTHCNGIFFVAPEAPPQQLVSVSCGNCGAVYQFAPTDIPAAGYDAQCTQCQAVFFVGPQMLNTDPSVAAHEAVDDVPVASSDDFASMSEVVANPLLAQELGANSAESAAGGTKKPFAPQALHRGTMELDLDEMQKKARRGKPARRDADRADDAADGDNSAEDASSYDDAAIDDDLSDDSDAPDTSDVMAIDAELGEPLADAPSDVMTPDVEEEEIRDRRSHRWFVAIGTVLAVVAGIGLMYLATPRFFDVTLGRLVGVKRTVAPEAMTFFDRGRQAMLGDTDAAYGQAAQEFAQALKIDPDYADALALGAMAHAWRGADLQAQGQQLLAQALQDEAELRAYQELPGNKTALVITKINQLQQQARTRRENGTDMLETGGHYLSVGMELLLRARRQFPRTPIVAEAAAICYSTDPDTYDKAERALARSMELRYGPKAPPRTAGPPDAWVPLAQGTLFAAQRGAAQKAVDAFNLAIKQEPGLQRARWLLARLYAQTGQKEEAKHRLDEILEAVPAHSKGKSLLLALLSNAATVPVAATALPSGAAASQSGEPAGHYKAKRHHSKRH